MRSIVLVVHNVRSTHNVGSILRTADGLGINEVYFSGYTPYPVGPKDTRLPHQAAKTNHQIHKTALGAEKSVAWQHNPSIDKLLVELKSKKYMVVALEQSMEAVDIRQFTPPTKIALIVGSEIGGLPRTVLDLCDAHIHIPMSGKKESLNVAVAAAIVMYYLKNLA